MPLERDIDNGSTMENYNGDCMAKTGLNTLSVGEKDASRLSN